MATSRIEFEGLSSLDLGDVDGIAEDMLEAASPIYVDALKRAVKATIQHDGDSELVESIRATKPKKAKNGAYIVNVNPTGYSSTKVYHHTRTRRGTYKVSNGLKAVWKEYGIPGQQAPTPFLTAAQKDAEGEVLDAMQEKMNERTGAE